MGKDIDEIIRIAAERKSEKEFKRIQEERIKKEELRKIINAAYKEVLTKLRDKAHREERLEAEVIVPVDTEKNVINYFTAENFSILDIQHNPNGTDVLLLIGVDRELIETAAQMKLKDKLRLLDGTQGKK